MTIRAVLLDLDGTLIDSEPIWAIAERELCGEYGIDWTSRDTEHIRGWALLDAGRYLRERGVELEPGEIIDRMETIVNERLRQRVPWTEPGARILAQCADRGIPVAIVTMSRRPALDIVLDALPAGSVAASIAGDEVSRGKPDPAPYLAGAAALGVEPAACAALEDTLTGSRSALGAGCQVATVGPLRGTIPGTVGLDPDADLDVLLSLLSQRPRPRTGGRSPA